MRNLRELEIKPYSRRDPHFRAPTEDEVAQFEQAFGVRLPADYLEFLRQFNGGRPTINAFTTASGYTTAVGRFYYLLPENSHRIDKTRPNAWEFGNLWADTRSIRMAIRRNQEFEGFADVREQMTERVVPFAIDTGGASQFVFDFRWDQPIVCLAVASRGFSLVQLADSFSDFIDALEELEDD